MMNAIKRYSRTIALLGALTLALAACGGSETADSTMAAETTMADMADDTMVEDTMTDDTMTEDTMTEDTMTDDSMTDDMADLTAANFGDACAAVPADGEGSFEGMADDPAATAASANPVLSTLVTAVTAAGLGDTLNGEGPFTIFAPYNDAFAAVDGLDDILADEELLTSILTYHVVAGDSWNAQELADAGSVTTVNGADLTIEADGDTITINGAASVICGNVQTANATVHIIDSVLVPSS